MARISGTLAAAVSPLRDQGERLDEAAFEPLLEFYARVDLEGLLILGTTGEGFLLEAAERRRVTELTVAGRRGLAVIVHCGARTTAETCALAAHSAEAGADAVAVIGPPYFPFASNELIAHFAAAAAACAPLPFYLYEYADRTGYTLPVDTVQRLQERAPNLAGMKVSDSPFERVSPYLATGLDVFIGAEAVIPEGLENGAVGAVSGVAAAFPEAVAALVRDPTTERAGLVSALREMLSRHPFQTSVKAALGIRGVAVSPAVRAPLLPLPAAAVEELRASIERLTGPV